MSHRLLYYGQPVNVGHPLNRGLVAWWYGLPGQSSGSQLFNVLPGRKYAGTLSGATWLHGQEEYTPKSGAVLCADTQKVAVTHDAVFNSATTEPYAVSMWVRFDGTARQIFFGKGTGSDNNAFFFDYNDFTVAFMSGGSHTGFLGAITTGVWYHLVGLSTGAATALYQDGRLLGTAGAPSTNITNTGTLNFGVGASDFDTLSLNGAIKDIRFYRRGLLADEVRLLYGEGRQNYPNLLNRLNKWSFGTSVAAAGIAFDAATNSGYNAASNSFSWSHTCTGTDRYLAVDIGRLSVSGTTVTALTYAGVSLTQIGATSSGTDAGRIEMWGLVNPASGSNTISVTLSAICISAGCAVSYTGVHQTVPTEAYNGATATNVGAADATVTITTVADNDWVHGALATDDGDVTANQTTRNEVNGAGGSVANEDTGPKTPAGTQAVSYTDVGAAATWTIGGYGIRPVAASGLANTTGLFLASLGVG